MAQATLAIYRLHQPLKTPYRLSFDTLLAFETLVLALSIDGEIGLGEITPLPGYSDETIDSALTALDQFRQSLCKGAPFQETVSDLVPTAPMVASALTCTLETLSEGIKHAFEVPVPGSQSLAGLCGGATPEAAAERARTLQQQGFTHLKLKAGGGTIAEDIGRLRAVAAACAQNVTLSVDANQSLSYEDAVTLCEVAGELRISLVEQPFGTSAWSDFERLAKVAPVPLMLDESIWDEADVDRSAEVGATWIKLKLCKHPGMAASHALIHRARDLGLDVVFGNGVQGALGNHLEARIYATAGLATPGEFNGVFKVAADPFNGRFAVDKGRMIAGGIPSVTDMINAKKPLYSAMFTM